MQLFSWQGSLPVKFANSNINTETVQPFFGCLYIFIHTYICTYVYVHISMASTSALQCISAVPRCRRWHDALLPSQASKPSAATPAEQLSWNIYWHFQASWPHFNSTTSLNRIHHKTRKEMRPDRAKCGFWGSSGKPWRLTCLFFFFSPTASSQGKVDRIILPKQSSDMKELTKKSALSQGKGNLNDFS